MSAHATLSPAAPSPADDGNMSSSHSSIHPALHPSVTNVPVTPGVTLAGKSAYLDSNDVTEEPKKTKLQGSNGQPQCNATSYFAPKQGEERVALPTDLLQNPSLPPEPAKEGEQADFDARTAYPNLNLSGGIISTTICVPFDVGHVSGGDWDLKSRRGTSALFDSLSYLASSQSAWNHTLVGWTGEVRHLPSASLAKPNSSMTLNGMMLPINKASAPVPVHPTQKTLADLEAEGVRVSGPDRVKLERQMEGAFGGRMAPVWLPDEYDEASDTVILKDQARWRKFADRELYTLFHYKQNEPTDGRNSRKWWADYCKMNKLFADRIIEVYKPGDVIMIHDYYLLLLPSLLRQRIPNVYIGFYLHIPFPSSEFYRCLSRRKEILEGVLGANMIGFQSYSYSRHFASCCSRILSFDSSSAGVDAFGAHIAVDVFPIGIDALATQHAAFEDPAVADRIAGIRQLYQGRKLAIGRDRLDSVRGVYQKLQAFETFLEKYPEWREKVVLIQITSPGSQRIDQDEEDVKIANKISGLVARINGIYGSLHFALVQHFPQYLSREEYFALLRVADIGLITSVRDGMNTTALEYVIGQKDNCGPLILSEFSGTAGSLDKAILVNPWDLGGVADAIDRALTMSVAERQQMQEALYTHVFDNNVQSWTTSFLRRLLANLSSFDQSAATPALDRAKLLQQYRKAKRRLFMFDYDGTLTPIVRDPDAAIPSDRVIRNLKTLASDPNNAVWIISGRDQKFLDEWMGHVSELGLSAEHGCFMRRPGDTEWTNLAAQTDMSWQPRVLAVLQQYTERTQGTFIERKKVALTWHYRMADPEYGAFQAKECRKELEEGVVHDYDIEVMSGKANVEVRPRFVNKGEIAKRLLKEEAEREGGGLGFVLCLGDDLTDEDMFRALRTSKLPEVEVFSVTIGASSKQTLAGWHLLEPADVISTISLLNGNADASNVGAVSGVEGENPENRA